MTCADKDVLVANPQKEAVAVADEDRATFYALDVAFTGSGPSARRWRAPMMS